MVKITSERSFASHPKSMYWSDRNVKTPKDYYKGSGKFFGLIVIVVMNRLLKYNVVIIWERDYKLCKSTGDGRHTNATKTST